MYSKLRLHHIGNTIRIATWIKKHAKTSMIPDNPYIPVKSESASFDDIEALQRAQGFPRDPERKAASLKLSRAGQASRSVLSNKFGKRLQSINNTVYKLSSKKPVEGTSKVQDDNQVRQHYDGLGSIGWQWVPSKGKWEFRVPCCEVKCTANMLLTSVVGHGGHDCQINHDLGRHRVERWYIPPRRRLLDLLVTEHRTLYYVHCVRDMDDREW